MASKKAKGKRAHTRDKFKKRGSKATVNKLLQEIPIGTKVDIKVDSSIHSGLPSRRFHGETGTVVSKQGRAFIVELQKRGTLLVIGAAHLNISRGSINQKAKKPKEVKVRETKKIKVGAVA
ncbi:MAG TPA: 50S ribosomal protein L21e [archaeon]|nr:50S ribosomal protein L21e [archaeon]